MEKATFQLTMGGKTLSVFESPVPGSPIVYLNTVQGEGTAVLAACRETGCPPFTLAAISGLAWDHDMSPWAIPPIAEGDTPCTGGADVYLGMLTHEIIPAVEGRLQKPPVYRCLAGYSLAGLFAVYAMYRTDAFARIASASGSFWFPGFTAYATEHAVRRKPDRLYVSLGDREAMTTNPVLRPVEENTRMLERYYAGIGMNTTFVLQPGNHFTQPNRRMAVGIAWMLTDLTQEEVDKP